jgi:hypothetical protein
MDDYFPAGDGGNDITNAGAATAGPNDTNMDDEML